MIAKATVGLQPAPFFLLPPSSIPPPVSIEERQQEEKAQRRRSIVDAAEAVLGRVSMENMTMADIASEARLSRSLLYVYFEDMEDIVLAVTLRGFEALAEQFEAAVQAHDAGLMQIRAVGEAYVRFAHEQPTYFDLVARFEARSADPEAATDRERACLAAADRVMTAMTDAIQNGIDDGSIRPDLDPTETATMLWGYTHGLIQLMANKETGLKQQYGINPDALIDRGLDFIGVALTGTSPHPAPNIPTEAFVAEQGKD